MRFETFRGPELGAVSAAVREAMGHDALVVGNRVVREGRRMLVEIVAVAAADVEAFRQRLEPGPIAPREERGGAPYVIALVGPAGSGKTTMAGRLAQLPSPTRGRTGVISVRADADRPGSPAGDPHGALFERLADSSDVPRALERLAECALLVVDTPALNRRDPAANREWVEAVERIDPNEVHLVLPAHMRVDVAVELRDRYGRVGVTHVLLTKLDEVPGESGVVDLAFRVDLPSRWASDHPGRSGDLHPASTRILAALGVTLEAGTPDLVVGTR